jgi:hypothetical protein
MGRESAGKFRAIWVAGCACSLLAAGTATAREKPVVKLAAKEPLAVAGPPRQRAAPPAWRPRRPALQLRTSGPLPARSAAASISYS